MTPADLASVEVHAFVYERLTAREQQILRRLRQGKRPRSAARGIGRSPRALLRRRRRALDRLGINDIRNLLRMVEDLGL